MVKNVIPWYVNWPEVYAIDDGGPGSTALAEKILHLHNSAGAMGVRMHWRGDTQRKWLLNLYRATGTTRMVGLVWNSVFRDADTPEKLAAAYVRWRDGHSNMIRAVRPDVIYVDHETRASELPQMLPDLRVFVDRTLGAWTPIYVYHEKRLFGTAIGTAPCPAIYYMYHREQYTPAESVHGQLNKPDVDVKGGYPWISPHFRADKLDQGLAPRELWLEVCTEIRDAGAAGFSMYPSAWSTDAVPIDDPVHETVLDYMQAANALWE